jgi:RNA 2',3'-cyclic 3'-phosphodiesterase
MFETLIQRLLAIALSIEMLMRTFIALVPPAEVTERLTELGREIRRVDRSLRYEQPDKLHFTLEFLGEKTEPWIEACREALMPGISLVHHFPVSITRIGFFPGPEKPRIIWAGSRPDENTQLCMLASEVKRVCTSLGHVGDPKPFHPHITLTRIKTRLSPGTVDRLAGLDLEHLEFECREVSFIKCTLGPAGSHYSLLHTVRLEERTDAPH